MNDRHPPELVITNRVPPVGTPGARPMGDIPVIVRLVLEDGVEQWRPATANRWTATQVLVMWMNSPRTPWSRQMCWLSASDVSRKLEGTPIEMSALWRDLRNQQPPDASAAH